MSVMYGAAAGAAAAAACFGLALYLIIWRHRRRKLGSLDSKSSPRDPGSPHGGLPVALQPVYKQGSADSQEPFLDSRRRMVNLMHWRRSKAGKEHHTESLVSPWIANHVTYTCLGCVCAEKQGL